MPIKSFSSSLQGSEQTHDKIDPRILKRSMVASIRMAGASTRSTLRDLGQRAVEKVARAVNPRIVNGRWTEYPNPASQKAFLD
jgi:hypothetical protein